MSHSDEQRFWSQVEQAAGCWLWRGRVSTGGYGRVFVAGRLVGAHRYSYELHIGPIPAGLHIDHLCKVRRCVRPDHLEAVTAGTNVLRGTSPWAQNARKVECPRGHTYDGTDHRGARICWTCERRLRKLRDARRLAG